MAGPMTQAATRIVDPVNTRVARGYRNEMHAHHFIFPRVQSDLEAGHVIEFGAEHFAAVAGLEHAPGADRAEVEFGYQGKAYSLTERALDGKLPEQRRREAARAHGLDLGMHTVRGVAEVVSQLIEIAAATLATATTTYSNDHQMGGANWQNVGADPTLHVMNAREIIATDIGVYPNLMWAGPKVTEALSRNDKVLDQIKHTRGLDRGAGGVLVEDADLAQFFRVERYITCRARKGTPGAFVPIWGNHAGLVYSDVSPLRDRGSPSFGYTYYLTGYPMVAPAWFNAKNDSWLYPYTDYSTPVVAGAGAGFLWPNAVT